MNNFKKYCLCLRITGNCRNSVTMPSSDSNPVKKQSYFSMVISVILLIALFMAVPYPLPVVAGGTSEHFDLMKSVKAHTPLRTSPKRSDVVFSTRWKRENALETIQSFEASRVEWMYSTDSDYIRLLERSVGWVGGAMNANVKTSGDKGVARNFDGSLIIAPWMSSWGAKWVTTTHPLTRRALFAQADEYIRAGVNSIQFDDPLLQLHSADWGGDFSLTTLSGFRGFLQRYPNKKQLASMKIHDLHQFDYKEYLKEVHSIRNNADYLRKYRSLPTTPLWKEYLQETVTQFFKDFRQHLDRTSGRRFPLSMNLGTVDRPNETNVQFFLTPYADYVIAETPIKGEADLYARAATFRSLGIGYIPSTASDSVAKGRRAIAMFYSLGATPLVPWDVFIVGEARYYGTVGEYGDLYHFVRKHSYLFDDWEIAPVVGIVIPIDKYREADTMTLVRKLVSNNVPFAFVPTGGSRDIKYTLDRQRIEHFKVLMTVNPLNDFSPKDRDILHSVSSPKLSAGEISEATIRNLSPFFHAKGKDNLRLITNGNTTRERMDELAIHVIAPHGQVKDGGLPCTRTIGIKSSMLDGKELQNVTWHCIGGTSVEVEWNKVAQGFRIELPTCNEWGIIHMKTTSLQ